jgi:hypothetical protein
LISEISFKLSKFGYSSAKRFSPQIRKKIRINGKD